MKKYLTISDLRDFEILLKKEEVTYSRAVEILNEKINYKVNADRHIDFNDPNACPIKVMRDIS